MKIKQPQNARSQRTVATLLAAARSMIEQRGFEAVTMAAVAESAGVTRRAVYLHFSTRMDLLLALYRSLGGAEDLAHSLQAVWDSPNAMVALREWAHHIARSHPRILAIMLSVERARHADPDAAELWNIAQGNWLKGSRRLVQWLADDGCLASQWTVDTATDMVWALMSPDLLDRLLHQRDWTREQFAEAFTALLTTTLTETGIEETDLPKVSAQRGARWKARGSPG